MLPPLRHIPPLGPGKSTARERVVAQWRGMNLASLEKARASWRSAGTVLPGVLSGLRMDARRAEAEVVKVWNGILDPAIVAHAQPTGLRKGTLFVNVDSSAWL